MRSAPRSTLARLLALAGMACAAALISNALAPSARRLAWSASVKPLPVLPPINRLMEPTIPAPAPVAVPEPKAATPLRPGPIFPARPALPATPTPRSTEEVQPSNPIREISGQEAWKAFQGGAPFLDARRSAEFAEGHVAGAWSAPVWESDLDDRLLSFKAARRPGPDDPIVIYCSGGDCRDSHLLAARLLNEGYFHLLIFRDGFPAWVAQGHPVEKGQP